MSPCNEENNAICGNLPSSMRPTCPSHLSLFAVMYADKVATPHDFLICSLVCRFDSLTPRMLLRQLECTRSSFCNLHFGQGPTLTPHILVENILQCLQVNVCLYNYSSAPYLVFAGYLSNGAFGSPTTPHCKGSQLQPGAAMAGSGVGPLGANEFRSASLIASPATSRASSFRCNSNVDGMMGMILEQYTVSTHRPKAVE